MFKHEIALRSAPVFRKEAAAPIDIYGNLFAPVANDVVLTYNGTLLTFFTARCVDHEGMPSENMFYNTIEWAEDVAKIDKDIVCLTQWMEREEVDWVLEDESPDPVYNQMAARRAEWFKAKGLKFYANKIYYAMEFPFARPQKQGLFDMVSSFAEEVVAAFKSWNWSRVLGYFGRKEIEISEAALQQYIENTVYPTCDSFEKATRRLGVRRLTHDEFVPALRHLHNLDKVKRESSIKAIYPSVLNYFLENSTIEIERKGLILDDQYYVDFIALRNIHQESIYHMLVGFECLPFPFILTTQWARVDERVAEGVIKKQARTLRQGINLTGKGGNPKTDAWKDRAADKLVDALEKMKSEGQYYGKYSLTVMYWAEDKRKLNEYRQALFKVFDAMSATYLDEAIACWYQFWNIMPGHYIDHCYRRLIITNLNHACYSLIFALSQGEPKNEFYEGPCLSVMTTRSMQPYYMNLSVKDNPHFLMLGATGAGKSFLIKYLIIQYRKYSEPWFWLHTVGPDYEDLCKLLNGQYLRFSLSGKYPINLYCMEEVVTAGSDYFNMILGIWRELFHAINWQPTEEQWSNFQQGVEMLLTQPLDRRTNVTLMLMVEEEVRKRVAQFSNAAPALGYPQGQYGALFDGHPNDPATIKGLSKFTVFDYSEFVKLPNLQRALMQFVCYLQDRVIYDEAYAAENKFCWVDEGAQIVDNPDSDVAKYLQRGGNTWRKHRCSLAFISQRLSQLRDLNLLDMLTNSTKQIIFLPNPGIKEDEYKEAFEWITDQDTRLIKTMTEKKEFLLKRPPPYNLSKVLSLVVDEWTEMLLTSDSRDRALKMEMYEKYGFPLCIDKAVEARRTRRYTADVEQSADDVEAKRNVSVFATVDNLPALIPQRQPAAEPKPIAVPVEAAVFAVKQGDEIPIDKNAQGVVVMAAKRVVAQAPPAAAVPPVDADATDIISSGVVPAQMVAPSSMVPGRDKGIQEAKPMAPASQQDEVIELDIGDELVEEGADQTEMRNMKEVIRSIAEEKRRREGGAK